VGIGWFPRRGRNRTPSAQSKRCRCTVSSCRMDRRYCSLPPSSHGEFALSSQNRGGDGLVPFSRASIGEVQRNGRLTTRPTILFCLQRALQGTSRPLPLLKRLFSLKTTAVDSKLFLYEICFYGSGLRSAR